MYVQGAGTMSMSFSGVGSGLPVGDWIDQLISIERKPINNLYIKKSGIQTAKTTLNTVESKVSSLRSMIEKLTDGNLASTFDLFSKRSSTSSDSAIATATVSNNASIQNLNIKVETLATATKAQTVDGTVVAKVTDGTQLFTDLGDKQGVEGTFSLYIDGIKKEFTITETSTLNSIRDEINTAAIGVTASVTAEGKFELSYDSTKAVTLGSNGDTSNFFNITQLSTASPAEEVPGTKTYTSLNALSAVNSAGNITSTANLDVAVPNDLLGTFKIGEATFTIDENTTFSNLIAQINSSSDAGVVAQYDLRSNKLILTSKNPGQTAINLQDETNDPANSTSKFLTEMGLISVTGDSLASQTLGTNAKVYLNGSTDPLYVNSNTVTGDISGIAGVTINLVKADATKTVDINVAQDTSQLETALNDLVNKFNEVVNEIDKTTASTGSLKSDSSLIRMRSDFRQTITDRREDLDKFDSLAMIGITTGSVGTSIQASTKNLSFDKSKFLEALAENPEEVRALLIGDESKGITGIFQTLETKVESTLDPVNGYFASREDSMDSSISDIEKSIKRGETRIESIRKRLVAQFSAMDSLISNMRSQSSSLSMLGI